MKKFIKNKVFIFITTLIFLSGSLLVKFNIDANATTKADPKKPSFTIELTSVEPKQVSLGQEVTVKGKITPNAFVPESNTRDIVLVVDTSGVIGEEVQCTNKEMFCTEHQSTQCNKNDCKLVNTNGKWWKCSEHNIEFKSDVTPKKCSANNHVWVNSYCSKHQSNSEHYIEENLENLKKAINEMLNIMKDESNVRIAIVSYDETAQFMTKDKNGKPIFISSQQVSELNGVINSLQGNEAKGSNIGEGLRKATYILENISQASADNKTIIMLSGNVPNYYSTSTNGQDKYFTEISTKEPKIVKAENGDALTYASEVIGGIIKSKNYNIYTTSYNMNKTDTEKIEAIHKAMGGKLSSADTLESEKTFFEGTSDTIVEVYKQIANNINESYIDSEVESSIDLSKESDFEVVLDSSIINLNKIKYNKKNENGNVKYEAVPIEFEFKIKPTKESRIELFKNTKVAFQWGNEIILIDMPIQTLEVVDNQAPKIEVTPEVLELDGVSGEQVEIVYNVTSSAIGEKTYQDSMGKKPKDIVLIIDNVNINEYNTNFKANYISGIKSLVAKSNEVRYGIVTYDNKQYQLNNYNNTDIESFIKDISDSNTNTNIDTPITTALNMLKNTEVDSDKYIVFVSIGTFNISNEKITELKNSPYNIYCIDGVNYADSTALKNLYNNFVGGNKNYYCDEEKVSNSNSFKGQNLSKFMGGIYSIIINSGTYKQYIAKATLQFDLGDNFNFGSGFTQVNGNIGTIELPPIRYSYDKVTLQYKPESIPQVKFSVIPKAGKVGALKFGTINQIIYNAIDSTEARKNITTPTINVVEGVTDIAHGLDEGIRAGGYYIRETNISIADNMEVDLAAYVDLKAKEPIQLKIDKNIDLGKLENIKVYTLEANGINLLEGYTVTKELTADDIKQNYYNISISDEMIYPSQIIILYKCKMASEGTYVDSTGLVVSKTYENNIVVGSGETKLERPFKIKGAQLPDLF